MSIPRFTRLELLYEAAKVKGNEEFKNNTMTKVKRAQVESSNAIKLRANIDDQLENYYSTILHREPPVGVLLSQLINQAGNWVPHKPIDTNASKSEVIVNTETIYTIKTSSQMKILTTNPKTSGNITLSNPIKDTKASSTEDTKMSSFIEDKKTSSIENKKTATTKLSIETDKLKITSSMEDTKTATTKLSIEENKKLNRIEPETALEHSNVTSFSTEKLSHSTDHPKNKMHYHSTSGTKKPMNTTYGHLLLLMAHKFDEIEQKLQTIEHNQGFLTHKVKELSEFLNLNEDGSTTLIRTDIDKIIEQITHVGNSNPFGSQDVSSNVSLSQ